MQDSFAYNERPVSLTIEVLLIKIVFSSFLTTEVFVCSKVINTFKQWNLLINPFWESSKLHKSFLLSFFAKHVWLWSCNNSYSQFPLSPLGTPGTMTPISILSTKKKNGLQIMSLAFYTSETNNYCVRTFIIGHILVKASSQILTLI